MAGTWFTKRLAGIANRFNFLAPGAAAAIGTTQPLYRQVATYRLFDWLAGIPDPDEVLLRTGRTRANLRELLRDSEVSQALDTRQEAVLATPWRFEPSGGVGETFVVEQLTPHMEAIVAGLWAAVPYGYAVLEPVYTRIAGKVGIGQIYAPPFEWFKPLPDKTLRFFPEDGSGGMQGFDLGPRKFIFTTRGADYRQPYGQSLLSSLYWPVTWRLQGWQLWLDFLDTFGAPIVVGKTANYEAFVDAMAKQGVRRAVGWQPVGDNESIDTITASAPGEFDRLENALNRTIQKVVLGQTLTSEVTGTGSYAAAKVHDEVRDDKRRSDIRIVSVGVQRLVNALWELNAFPGTAPKFVMQDNAGLEKERADRDTILYAMGVEFTEEYFTDRYDLEPGDFKLAPKQPPPSMVPGVDPNANPKAPPNANPKAAAHWLAGAGPRFTPTQEVIEKGIADLMRVAGGPLRLADLRAAIVGARNEMDLAQRLAVLIDNQDPDFAELLARATFAAQVLGYVHATEAPAQP